jgi:hypothetical protein
VIARPTKRFKAREEHRLHDVTQELVLLVVFTPART